MNKLKSFLMAFLLLFFSSFANASFFDLEQGYPRIVDNNTKISGEYVGIVNYFEAKNMEDKRRGRSPYVRFKEGAPRLNIENADFFTWADIRVIQDGSAQLLDGMFEAHGDIDYNGQQYSGLMFSASLMDVASDELTIAFKMGGDQQGYLCDLGLCSFANELLEFNLTSEFFDGDFAKDLDMTAQTVATVPVPAAVLLFGTSLLGLAGFKKKRV